MGAELRAAIIGCGDIAHHDHLPAYSGCEGVSIESIAEVDPERRRQTGEQYDVSTEYESGLELLANEDIDLVSICTPVPTHEKLVVAAAQRDVAVYCEKPFAPDAASAERMNSAAESNDVVTQVGYKYRLTKNFQRVLRMINADIFGRLLTISTSFHSSPITKPWYEEKDFPGGGVAKEIFAHHLDFYLEVFDDLPTVEYATAKFIRTGNVEDFIEVGLDFGSVRVTANLGQTQPQFSLHKNHVIGMEGTAELNPDRLTVNVGSGTIGSRFEYKSGQPPTANVYVDEYWKGPSDSVGTRRVVDFVDHVRSGDRETAAPFSRGVDVTRVTDAIYEKAGVTQ